MRRLLIIVGLFLCFSSPSKATVVNVQHCLIANTAAATTACTFTNNIGAGNAVWCTINNISFASSPAFAVFSGVGGTWHADINNFNWALHGFMFTAYATGVTGGSKTVTATNDGVINWGNNKLICDEFSGLPGPFVTSDNPPNNNGGVGGTALSSFNVTTTVNGNFLLGTMIATGGAITSGSGWTTAANSTSVDAVQNEWQTQSTAGTIAATGTAATGNWVAHIAVFGSALSKGSYFPQMR